MQQCPTALPETYECSPVSNLKIGQDLRLVDVSSFLHYLLPVTRLLERGLASLHKTIPGPLQGPATLNEINHYHHDRDDQQNVNDSAHGVRGD